MPNCDRCKLPRQVVTRVHEGNGEDWCDDCISAYEKARGVKVGHCPRCGKRKVQPYLGGEYLCSDQKCRETFSQGQEKKSEEKSDNFSNNFDRFNEFLADMLEGFQEANDRRGVATVMFAARMICNSLDNQNARPQKYERPEKLALQAVRDADLLLQALEGEEEDADGKVSEDRH